VLTDPHKRAAYDQYGHAGVEASARGGGARGGGFGADTFSDIFGDVFGDIFGGARRGGRSQVFRGADLRYELQLELPQAVFGHQVEIEIPRLAECEVCHGSGAAKGSTPATCDTCGGAGQVRISQGFFQLQQTCPRCRGTGTIVRNPCDSCLGRAGCAAPASSRSKCPPESTMAIACAWRARAKPDATAVRPGTCTSKCTCANTPSSSATAST